MSSSVPCLYLYVNNENKSLTDTYRIAIQKHNLQVRTDPFPNSGFDLFTPVTQEIAYNESFRGTLVDLQVKGEMKDEEGLTIPYKLYPRSSLSNTPLMLSNSVGIIDSGYRGFLKASFRNLSSCKDSGFTIEENSRYVQICHPSLKPFTVKMLEYEDELSSSSRGSGGFGSTGGGFIPPTPF